LFSTADHPRDQAGLEGLGEVSVAEAIGAEASGDHACQIILIGLGHCLGVLHQVAAAFGSPPFRPLQRPHPAVVIGGLDEPPGPRRRRGRRQTQ
jgi:hypothetical protein